MTILFYGMILNKERQIEDYLLSVSKPSLKEILFIPQNDTKSSRQRRRRRQ